MGQEETQSHTFQCLNCGEDITVGLDVNYKKFSHGVVVGENAKYIDEVARAPIVNVDANFLIPQEQQGQDLVFPRLTQLHELLDTSKKFGKTTQVPLQKLIEKQDQRPYRRPDFHNEWAKLKKAWSLHKRGKHKLSSKRIRDGSLEFYKDEPIDDLADWLWRLSLNLTTPAYHPPFENIMQTIQPLWKTKEFKALLKFYDQSMSEERGRWYFELFKDFFSGYTEFSQVYFRTVVGLKIPPDFKATSLDFDRVRMFYGNAFEAFAKQVDLLAYLNNLLCGRNFDEFENLTFDKYNKLDQASRFGPFKANVAFSAICCEADNKIRNASHHGHLVLDEKTQVISYRSGKGGKGPKITMTYANYLKKCTCIFLQAITLLKIELILSDQGGCRPPL